MNMSGDVGRKSRPHIDVGYRVGLLTVDYPTKEKHSGYTVWHCKCECGGEILLDTRYLQRGTVTDCGCITKVKPGQRDLIGQRFGRLICIAPTEDRVYRGSVVWLCKCDCGNECTAPAKQLLSGYKKSCGCLGHPPLKDLVGKHFGKLTVIAYAGKRAGMHRWKCLCDCGNETIVGQSLLQSGKTKSCGCVQREIYKLNLKLVDGTSVVILESNKSRLLASNTSGHTGVYRNKKNGKWVAQITFKRKTYNLGSYERIEDAIKARQRGEEMHEDFLRWYYEQESQNELSPNISKSKKS